MVLADSLGPRDHFAHVLFGPRPCFVRVLWVLALLDRGLGPPAWFARALFRLHVFCECFVIASVPVSQCESV